MENKEQIRQSLEDIYNQILPTLDKLEVKRLESVKIKKRFYIQFCLGLIIILFIGFCIIFYYKNFESIYLNLLYLPVIICILWICCIFNNRINFNKKELKKELKNIIAQLFNLYRWNDSGYTEAFKGKYKDVDFNVTEIPNKLFIKFNTNRFYKVKTTIYTKSSRPKYIFSSDKLPDLFFLGFYCFLIIAPILILFFYILYQIDWKNVEINWETIKSIPMVIGYSLIFIGKELGFSGLLILSPIIYFFVYLHSCKVKKTKGELNLESVDFKNKFEVYGDEIEGRYALTTAFMNRLLTMQTAFGSGDLTCIIEGNNISFEIKKTKDLFEVADLNKPVNSPECIKEFYNEMTSIWDMIDHFKLDENTGL